jgi:hypothetical protein
MPSGSDTVLTDNGGVILIEQLWFAEPEALSDT